ncbi:uncharacterized protein [Anabrus simplex]|uniref:uncharacterized protein n=1 Tax=Anabrus simplex TaxID=316456 RepID=UPI0035A27DA7
MQTCVRILAFCAVCVYYVTAGSTKLAGPFELEFRRIEHCQDEGTKELVYHTKLNKVSKYEYAYNGECTVPNTTGVSVEADVFKKLNSGSWAKTFDYRLNDFCEDFKAKFSKIFRTYTEDYLKVASECPVPADTYTADNWVISIEEFPLEELEYGLYKVEAVFLRGEERIGCIQVYVDVEEKPAD